MIDRKMTLELHIDKDFAYDLSGGGFQILALILTLTLTLILILETLTPTLILILTCSRPYSGPPHDRSKNYSRTSYE